jgi:hypothetical protein
MEVPRALPVGLHFPHTLLFSMGKRETCLPVGRGEGVFLALNRVAYYVNFEGITGGKDHGKHPFF